MAMKKKAASSGSDRGAQMKADNAKKISQKRAQIKNSFYNQTPAQKKASSGKTTDLAGRAGYGNYVLPSKSGFVGNYSGLMGRTAQRGADQGKRAAAKPTKAQSARLTAQAKAAKKNK